MGTTARTGSAGARRHPRDRVDDARRAGPRDATAARLPADPSDRDGVARGRAVVPAGADARRRRAPRPAAGRRAWAGGLDRSTSPRSRSPRDRSMAGSWSGRMMDAARPCPSSTPRPAASTRVATSTDVIRHATVEPGGATLYEFRVGRADRTDLGVWRRAAGARTAERVLPPARRRRGLRTDLADGARLVDRRASAPRELLRRGRLPRACPRSRRRRGADHRRSPGRLGRRAGR